MAKKPLQDQSVTRRKPQQERALEKVGLMLEAATRILDKQGLAGLTTNRVAEVAGVSIGTVYQYFNDRSEEHTSNSSHITPSRMPSSA